MIRKRKAIYIVIGVLLLMGLYCYFMENRNSEKVAPRNNSGNLPASENPMPNKGKDEDSQKIEKQSLIPPLSSESVKIERSPSLLSASYGDPANLEEQSYSIKNKKKEIAITPGVTFQPGKSVNIKISDGDEVIRVQRDKRYHPGGYNVLWEKKY